MEDVLWSLGVVHTLPSVLVGTTWLHFHSSGEISNWLKNDLLCFISLSLTCSSERKINAGKNKNNKGSEANTGKSVTEEVLRCLNLPRMSLEDVGAGQFFCLGATTSAGNCTHTLITRRLEHLSGDLLWQGSTLSITHKEGKIELELIGLKCLDSTFSCETSPFDADRTILWARLFGGLDEHYERNICPHRDSIKEM